jgi:hypothetical protein
MLRYERIRRFSYLKHLIVKWTNKEDLKTFIELLIQTEKEGDVIERIQRDLFNSVHAIELIRFYLNLESTRELDKKWLNEVEMEECNQKAYSIFKERLDDPEWGSVN